MNYSQDTVNKIYKRLASCSDYKSPCFFSLLFFIVNQYHATNCNGLQILNMLLFDVAPSSFSLSVSLSCCLSSSICLFEFPEGKAGQWAECFLEPAWEAKAKGSEGWSGGGFHSQPHNTLFMKPHVLLLFKAFSQHTELHPVSL